MVAMILCPVLFVAAGTAVSAESMLTPAYEAGVGMIVIAMTLAGLMIALVAIRILAGKMNTVRRQDCAKGYGKKLVLTEKKDVYLYSRTTSRRTQ